MILTPPIEFWGYFKKTPGAMSSAEALFLYNACNLVPNKGTWMEMGVHKGKSAIVSLMAWDGRRPKEFILLEPEFSNPLFLSEAKHNIRKVQEDFNIQVSCSYVPEYSTSYLTSHEEYSYIMWDSGDHGHNLVNAERPLLEDRIIPGGVLVMHDINSQFIACTEAYNDLIKTGKYEAFEMDWEEIFDYVKKQNLEEGNNSWHLYPELSHPPNFIGALIRK